MLYVLQVILMALPYLGRSTCKCVFKLALLVIGADDEYVTNLALLLKNGNEYTKPLSEDLPICILFPLITLLIHFSFKMIIIKDIEYSNEVWNWGFSQSNI